MTSSKDLLQNIQKVFFLNMAWMFLVIMPVFVPYGKSKGLSMEQIYQLQTIFALTLVLLDVPMGYVADLFGRKACMILASFLSAIGFGLLPIADSFSDFAAFEVLVAIGSSLFSGCDVAIVYDSLASTSEKQAPDVVILGKKLFYGQVGETLAALLASALVVYSLSLPAKVNAVTAWIPFFIALTLKEPPRSALLQRSKHWENFRVILGSLFRHSRLLTLIILNNIVYGLGTLLAVWAFQAYWDQIEIPIHYFGYLWAAYNLLVALVARAAHRVEKTIGSAALVAVIGILPIIGFFGMGLSGGWIGVCLGASFQVARGLNQVILKDAMNARVPASMRATANSMTSLGVRLSFALLGPLMGHLIDHQGLKPAFFTFGALYSIAFVGLCIPLMAQRRNFRPLAS